MQLKSCGLCDFLLVFFFFFQAEDGIRDAQESRGLGDVYKRQIKASLNVDFNEALKASEVYYLDGCMNTEDANEGISAFMEKRRAVWKDK